jgi:3-oxoacyl-[acyl-carrier-protein] synthase-3
MHASIAAIEYVLPHEVLGTSDLASLFPNEDMEKIDKKTGIRSRHIAAIGESASDLAFSAARRLFENDVCDRSEIDYLLFCTQSSDYILPATACLLQERLGIPTHAAAIDFSIGCSGYVYGLGICEGLVVSGQAKTILLITADTYSKYLAPSDKNARAVFGDGATATLLRAKTSGSSAFGPFMYGTDGRGAKHLICAHDGRGADHHASAFGKERSYLYMNGPKVFQFVIDQIPIAVHSLLRKAHVLLVDIDLFVFHQANAYLLRELRDILGIKEEKFYIDLEHAGNTVSSTIPIALNNAQRANRLVNGSVVMLVGFGVGFSWSATILRWSVLHPSCLERKPQD